MAAEPRRAPETLYLPHRPKDRLVVGRHLIQPSPCGFDARRREGGGTPRRLREHLLEELPADILDVARRLLAVAHANEDSITLRVEVERGLEIDRHRVVPRHRRKCAGDRDVPAIREDWNLQAGHTPDRRRPRARAIEYEARRHVPRRRAPSLHSARGTVDAGDRNALFQSRPEAPR